MFPGVIRKKRQSFWDTVKYLHIHAIADGVWTGRRSVRSKRLTAAAAAGLINRSSEQKAESFTDHWPVVNEWTVSTGGQRTHG